MSFLFPEDLPLIQRLPFFSTVLKPKEYDPVSCHHPSSGKTPIRPLLLKKSHPMHLDTRKLLMTNSKILTSPTLELVNSSGVSEASCAGGWEFLRLVVLQGRSSGVQEVTGRSSQVQESGRSRSSSSSLRAFKS